VAGWRPGGPWAHIFWGRAQNCSLPYFASARRARTFFRLPHPPDDNPLVVGDAVVRGGAVRCEQAAPSMKLLLTRVLRWAVRRPWARGAPCQTIYSSL